MSDELTEADLLASFRDFPATRQPRRSGCIAAHMRDRKCPQCNSLLFPEAISCPECAYFLLTDNFAASLEDTAHCANPYCGKLNPAGLRHCAHCTYPLPLPSGTVLQGLYQIESAIAAGSFGNIYRGIELTSQNRPIAIKELAFGDPEAFDFYVAFFRHEADILQSMEAHPLLPRLFACFQGACEAFMVMEFIEEVDLCKMMNDNGRKPFELDWVIELGKSLCDLLHLMHTQKPALLMVDFDEEGLFRGEDGRTVKLLADWGDARRIKLQQRRMMELLTRDVRTRIITESIRIPVETILGMPEPRTDLHRLASTLYFLATGQNPDPWAWCLKDELAGLARPKCRIAKKDRWFYELISANLSLDPNDRYYSPLEFKRDLMKREITRETNCEHCRQANRVRQPYCSHCGQQLTPPSPRPCGACGFANPMGCNHCTLCGEKRWGQ